MNTQSSNCRVCGIRLSNESLLTHELNCLQISQEKLKVGSPDGTSDSQISDSMPMPFKTPSGHVGTNNGRSRKEENVDDLNASSREPFLSDLSSYSELLIGSGKSRIAEKVDVVSANETSVSNLPPYPESFTTSQNDIEEKTINNHQKVVSNPGIHQEGATEEATPTSPVIYRKTNKGTEAYSKSASSTRYGRKKPDNLFPPTKKYHYYPITCEYCRKQFQPSEMKAHQKKYHFMDTEEGKVSRRVQSASTRKGHQSQKPAKDTKSVGRSMSRFQFCYICGKMYGSKSIKIHEPQCLKKWRKQNADLPPELRAPEPVKQEELQPVAEDRQYDIPAYNPQVEAAFKSHLSTLIPCRHCSRTFSPDRIQRHMSCCIERPKSRTTVTPVGGKIPR